METVKETIERYKVKADLFLKENIRAFIVTSNGDWNFCDIILVGENHIYIQYFAGNKEKESKERIFYVDIIKFEEYRERK